MLSKARARRRQQKDVLSLQNAGFAGVPRRQVSRLTVPVTDKSMKQLPYNSPTKAVDPLTGNIVLKGMQLPQDPEEAFAISLKERRAPNWPLWVTASVLLPILAALAIVFIVVFGTSGFISSSSNGFLMHLTQGSTKDPAAALHSDLWLGLSGHCIKPADGDKNCQIAALNTFYGEAYKSVALGELAKSLPSNFGSQASSLLAALIFFVTSCVFQIWALVELRKAERDEYLKRQRWVHEWMVARRLELFFLVFAIGALTCGIISTTTLAAQVAASCATVNALGPGLADSEFGECKQGNVTTVLLVAWMCTGFAVLLQLGVIAWDGLSRKLRFEYEQLFHDLEAFASDDFVVLQNKLNHMHAKAEAIHTASAAYADFRRKELEDYVVLEDVQSILRRQEQLILAQRYEFELLWQQTRPPVYGPPIPDQQVFVPQQQATYVQPTTPYYSSGPTMNANTAYVQQGTAFAAPVQMASQQMTTARFV